jgi:hypothetical protein
MLGYYSYSSFYGGESFFFLLSDYYIFDGENIYSSNGAPGNTAWSGSVAAIAEGLRFLSSDSQQALFWSPQDGWIYSFGGDQRVIPLLNLSDVIIKDACYTPSLDLHVFLTDTEALLMCKGQISCVKGQWHRLDTTLKGFVLYDDINYNVTRVSLQTPPDQRDFHGENGWLPQPAVLHTNWIQGKEGVLSQFTDLWIRFKKTVVKQAPVTVTWNTMLTLDKMTEKSIKTLVKFDEGADFQTVKVSLGTTGRAISLKIETAEPIQLCGVAIEAVPVGKSPVKVG